MTWRKIMVAVASTEPLDAALAEKTLRIATALDAAIELFHCTFDSEASAAEGITAADADVRAWVAARQRGLELAAQPLRRAGASVRAVVRWDFPPHEGIVREVLRERPDLLIAQSAPRNRAARLLLGYTDFKLIEACPCPVLLVKTSEPYKSTCTIAALDPFHAHDKPAALDDAVLDAAGELARALKEPLRVYHATSPWPDVARRVAALRRLPQVVVPDAEAAYRESIAARVREVAARHGLSGRSIHIAEGDAGEALPEYARAEGADVVVMGAVSRSGLRRIVIGHTAERVLDRLDCDALIVKTADFRSPVTRRSARSAPARVEGEPHPA